MQCQMAAATYLSPEPAASQIQRTGAQRELVATAYQRQVWRILMPHSDVKKRNEASFESDLLTKNHTDRPLCRVQASSACNIALSVAAAQLRCRAYVETRCGVLLGLRDNAKSPQTLLFASTPRPALRAPTSLQGSPFVNLPLDAHRHTRCDSLACAASPGRFLNQLRSTLAVHTSVYCLIAAPLIIDAIWVSTISFSLLYPRLGFCGT